MFTANTLITIHNIVSTAASGLYIEADGTSFLSARMYGSAVATMLAGITPDPIGADTQVPGGVRLRKNHRPVVVVDGKFFWFRRACSFSKAGSFSGSAMPSIISTSSIDGLKSGVKSSLPACLMQRVELGFIEELLGSARAVAVRSLMRRHAVLALRRAAGCSSN